MTSKLYINTSCHRVVCIGCKHGVCGSCFMHKILYNVNEIETDCKTVSVQ